MKSTKPIHYLIVIILAIAFMGLMRSRALKQSSFSLVDGSANQEILEKEQPF